MSDKKIRIKLIHSTIGRNSKQDDIVKGLGLRKLYGERELLDTPAIRGMVAKIPHLVKIIAENITSTTPVKKAPRAKKVQKEVSHEA